jgi:hypothetical protein
MDLEFELANMCLILGREMSKICKDEWYHSKASKLISYAYELNRCFKVGNSTDLSMKLVILSDCINPLTYLFQMTATLEEFSSSRPMIISVLFRATELLHSLSFLITQK